MLSCPAFRGGPRSAPHPPLEFTFSAAPFSIMAVLSIASSIHDATWSYENLSSLNSLLSPGLFREPPPAVPRPFVALGYPVRLREDASRHFPSSPICSFARRTHSSIAPSIHFAALVQTGTSCSARSSSPSAFHLPSTARPRQSAHENDPSVFPVLRGPRSDHSFFGFAMRDAAASTLSFPTRSRKTLIAGLSCPRRVLTPRFSSISASALSSLPR